MWVSFVKGTECRWTTSFLPNSSARHGGVLVPPSIKTANRHQTELQHHSWKSMPASLTSPPFPGSNKEGSNLLLEGEQLKERKLRKTDPICLWLRLHACEWVEARVRKKSQSIGYYMSLDIFITELKLHFSTWTDCRTFIYYLGMAREVIWPFRVFIQGQGKNQTDPWNSHLKQQRKMKIKVLDAYNLWAILAQHNSSTWFSFQWITLHSGLYFSLPWTWLMFIFAPLTDPYLIHGQNSVFILFC